MTTLVARVQRALRLDPAVYEEIEGDTSATGQALMVVVLAALCAGLGGAGLGGIQGVIGLVIGSILGWLLWAAIIYLVGGRLLAQSQTQVDMGQLLRTMGLAQSPGLLRIFGIVPLLGGLVVLVAQVWMLAAMVVAVRQALDYTSTARAVVVVMLGFLGYVLALALIAAMFGLRI
jgi:hypothetical protein